MRRAGNWLGGPSVRCLFTRGTACLQVARHDCFPLLAAQSYAKAKLGKFEPQMPGSTKGYDFSDIKEGIWKKIPEPKPEARAYMPPDARDDEDDHLFDGILSSEPWKRGSGKSLTPPLVVPLYSESKRLSDGITACGVGGRKSARATAWIRPGMGKITVNGRTLRKHWPSWLDRDAVISPLVVTERVGKFDVMLRVDGGGIQGQAGAARHAIARALQAWDIAFRPVLKKAGFITRDQRVVESKKPGRVKARKRPQWSKR